MKRALLFLGLSLALVNAFGQVVFQEDWEVMARVLVPGEQLTLTVIHRIQVRLL